MAKSFCLRVCLFVCLSPAWNANLSGTGLTGPAVLAAVSGRSVAGPVRPVPDILMAAGAQRVGRNDFFSETGGRGYFNSK